MSTRETTSSSTLGWPKPGPLERIDGTWSVVIDYGHGEIVRVTDPAWARQDATAKTAAANALESVLGIDMLPEAVPLTGGTQVMSSVPAVPGGSAAAHEGQWRSAEDSVAAS